MSRFTLAFEQADPSEVDRLGGKGAGLAGMVRAGLRVPPGYVVDTGACRHYLAAGALPDGLAEEVLARLAELEARSGKRFGGGPVPLLVSVRSGAPVSMPGMMDTVLNLGLCRESAVALAEATGDVRFMAEVVARFHAMYAEIVLGALDPLSDVDNVAAGADPGETYDRVWARCARELVADNGSRVPTEPAEQLLGAVEAVFRSWNTRRARTYRDYHKIPHDLGTAVVVQAMVFGNLGPDSGSGVVFTRDPATGEPGLFGEYLAHSQGEDVVSGTRTPAPVGTALAAPVLAELRATAAELERRHGDVLDIEFTVERSTLYFLQVRAAKRTAQAAVRIAADFLAAGMAPGAVLRTVSTAQVRQVQRPGFDAGEVAAARAGGRLLTTGIGACPGQVSGALVLDPERAAAAAAAGRAVVLARPVTSPADLHGMIAARGIVTATGGSTSHAAVVARAIGTACVVGAGALRVDLAARIITVNGTTVPEGAPVSLDGGTGELFTGTFGIAAGAAAGAALPALLGVARAEAGCVVLTRVTLAADVRPALDQGADGVVTAVEDVLAATGHLDGLIERLIAGGSIGPSFAGALADLVAAEFTGLLAAAGEAEVGVRAIDFVADESRELLRQTELTTRYPALSVPLGAPELIEAQLAGLARALRDSGGLARVHLAVRHVSDPAEALALRELGGAAGVAVGGYLTSPRAVHNVAGIAAAGDVLWLEVRALHAAVFGLPARQLLTAEPLDTYLRRGLYTTDPRSAVDPAVEPLLARVAGAAAGAPGCRVGMRLPGEVSEAVATQLHRLGVRRFAVDPHETRPALLALAKAALDGKP